MSIQNEQPGQSEQAAEQQIVKAVRIGTEWYVTTVSGERLDGKVNDGTLPTLADCAALFAKQGYAPVTSIEHVQSHVTAHEAETGLAFMFKKVTAASTAEQVKALAKPKPAAPVAAVPDGHVIDPRMAKGYRVDDSPLPDDYQVDPRLKPGQKLTGGATATKQGNQAPVDVSQLRRKF